MRKKIVITDYGFPAIDYEKEAAEKIGYDLVTGQCKREEEVITLCRNADGILAQWAPVSEKVMESLENCKIIVRYGIGVDNLDLQAAKKKGIPVCNVPDYCIDEVADHAVALAVALGRQLTATDKLVRAGKWKITPPLAMPPFREMVFATIGYGRIAREVLKRAAALGFSTAAFDLFVNEEEMRKNQVTPLTLAQLLTQADIISLHLPLNSETRHLINEDTIGQMKPASVIINTARGGLIDTVALAKALQTGRIGAAGLDVFEEEPLPVDHPLMSCDNTILTSHTAWYSASSIPLLQKMAMDELVRGLTDQPLRNRIA